MTKQPLYYEIILNQGYKTKVDKIDFDYFENTRLSVRINRGIPRAVYSHWDKTKKKHVVELVSRLITRAPKGMVVDHKNRDTLDNRRSNLRICTRVQNQQNRGVFKSNTSGYKGVWFRKERDKWYCVVKTGGKRTYRGGFSTKEEAAIEYNNVVRKLFGEFAFLNKVNNYISQ